MRYIKGYHREDVTESPIVKSTEKKFNDADESLNKQVDQMNNATKKECGEESLLSFIGSMKKQQSIAAERNRMNNDPVIKRNILKNQIAKCKEDSLGYMLGNLYMKVLPSSDVKNDPDINEVELRTDLGRFLKDKGGAVAYVKDGCIREQGKGTLAEKVLKRMMEAADEACSDYSAKMGIGMNTRGADEIRFSLDKELDIRNKLDNVTNEVDFDEICSAIRDNVTAAAMAEVERSKKEKEAAEELENSLRNNDQMTTAESVETFMNKRGKTRTVPSLMESIMIGKCKLFNESTSQTDWDKAFVGSICEYAKLALEQGLALAKHDKQSLLQLAASYRK